MFIIFNKWLLSITNLAESATPSDILVYFLEFLLWTTVLLCIFGIIIVVLKIFFQCIFDIRRSISAIENEGIENTGHTTIINNGNTVKDNDNDKSDQLYKNNTRQKK